MEENERKLNTVCDKYSFSYSECKLLLTNAHCVLHSVDVCYDDVFVGEAYRTVACESIALFDTAILNRLAYIGRGVRAAIAYSLFGGICNIISNRECTASAYAAAVLSLYVHGRIGEGERIRVRSASGELAAAVVSGGVILFA